VGYQNLPNRNSPKGATSKIGRPSLNKTMTIPERKKIESKANRQKNPLIKFSFCALLIIYFKETKPCSLTILCPSSLKTKLIKSFANPFGLPLVYINKGLEIG